MNTAAKSSDSSTRFLPILLLLFVGSGCSALVYEIVWFQILQLVIGSSAVSLGVLLGTFMGGMCLGSVGFSRVVSAARHPLRVYALLELGIGILGLLLLFLLPYVGQLYTPLAGGGFWGIAYRACVCALCLLPPTVLMGATLPAIARWVETTPRGVSRLGFFYGSNIAGAVFGCLLAGFYLLRVHDVSVATYVAVAINVGVAAIGWVLAYGAESRGAQSDSDQQPQPAAPKRRSVYVAIALSGMAALGAEVIWTRLLSLLLGATVYTFSIILAVFLVGLGIGSSVGSLLARGRMRPRVALGWCQLLLAGAIAWSAYTLTQSLPYWPIHVSLSSSPWTTFQLDLMRCVWAMLPAACLWGASFPLALAAAASPGQDPARLVGGVYAANTVGAIAGALVFSMLVISWLGTQTAQRLLIAMSAMAAVMMFAPLMFRQKRPPDEPVGEPDGLGGSLGLITMVGLVVLLTWTVPRVPTALIAYGRYLPTHQKLPGFLYEGEGMNASIAVSEWPDGTREFHVSGKAVASNDPNDMRLQRMLCHVPALLHPKPRSVLVVGCGAGVTAGSFLAHPDVTRVVICEIEPLIPPAAGKYFREENHNLMKDSRVRVVYDDARHFIATTNEKFDIITSDPIHPWVKGAAALYSLEFFQLCKRRLNPGGIVTQWVPLYETSPEAVQSQIATFFRAYPQGTIWSNDVNGAGYDVVLLGQSRNAKIDLDALQKRLERQDHSRVLASLDDVRLGSALSLLKTYAGRASDLKEWSQGAAINRDRNLRLQYLAGMGLNDELAGAIRHWLRLYCSYPEDLFVATGTRGEALKAAIEDLPEPLPDE